MMPSKQTVTFVFVRNTIYWSTLPQTSLPVQFLPGSGPWLSIHSFWCSNTVIHCTCLCDGNSWLRGDKWESCVAPPREDKWAAVARHIWSKENPGIQRTEKTVNHIIPRGGSAEASRFNKPEFSICVGSKSWKPEKRRCPGKETKGTQRKPGVSHYLN